MRTRFDMSGTLNGVHWVGSCTHFAIRNGGIFG